MSSEKTPNVKMNHRAEITESRSRVLIDSVECCRGLPAILPLCPCGLPASGGTKGDRGSNL